MRRAPNTKKLARKRTYPAPRLARAVEPPEPQRLLRVWRKVLERRLRIRLRARVAVEIHDNTHTMVTFHRLRGKWRLRLHHMFLAASDDVLSSLANFVQGLDPASSAVLDRYIERNRALIRRPPPSQLRKRLRIVTKGRSHDLIPIFASLNERYFQNRVSATITFGPAPRRQLPRKSIKMGSYSADSKVIRIHPALDHERVPRYFVEWIVFHEMLHHVCRARRMGDGRRCVHTPEFVARERTFHHFKRAQRWEQQNLDFLLQSPAEL
jgi:hypothetical protein